MKRYFVITALLLTIISVAARTRTTQTSLRDANAVVETIAADSASAIPSGVEADAIGMKGYAKRASDSKESFMLTNNTSHRLSHVTIKLRYTSMKGEMLHERIVTIPVQLNSGQTQLVSISTWDKQHLFYYYSGPKPRKSATPYKVAYRLIGYDIPVGQ